MTVYVAPIVEGHTEVSCLEKLLHRIWTDVLYAPGRLQVLQPSRSNRSSLVNATHNELGDRVNEAEAKVRKYLRRATPSVGFVLLMIDAESDCPRQLGPTLLARARVAHNAVDIVCVLPTQELENWFKAAAKSLAGIGGLPADLETPPDAEVGGGGKWLTEQKRLVDPQARYKKPDDAFELAKNTDLALCRANSPSFRKLCKELAARVPAVPPPPAADPAAG